MKGKNIVEGYCKVCGGPVSKYHLDMKYAIREDGNLVHIHHLESNKKILQDLNMLDALETLFSVRTKEDTRYTLLAKSLVIAKDRGIEFKDFDQALTIFMCHMELNDDPWKGFEWLKNIKLSSK